MLAYEKRGSVENDSIEIVCRGCSMRGRETMWHNFVGSKENGIDNSYLVFEPEPDNVYDPNAVKVICKGEFWGTLGYVAKEMTGMVRSVLDSCKEYRIDMVDEDEAGSKEIRLCVQWQSG